MPFFKSDELLIELGALYIPFAAFVVVGTANAVNLTDGLDGLAIGPVMTAALTFRVARLPRRLPGLREPACTSSRSLMWRSSRS